VALAGILPDADGLGLVVDWITNARGGVKRRSIPNTTTFCSMARLAQFLIAAVMAPLRRILPCRLARVVTFHLHLVCDLVGSEVPRRRTCGPSSILDLSLIRPMLLLAGTMAAGRLAKSLFLNDDLSLGALAGANAASFVGVFNRRGGQHSSGAVLENGVSVAASPARPATSTAG